MQLHRVAAELTLAALLTCVPLVLAAQDVSIEVIGDGVQVVHGAVNGVRIERDGQTLAVYGDPRDEPPAVDTVLFTHHRRDVVWAGQALVAAGSKAIVPAAERDRFADVAAFWTGFREARFHDYTHKSTKVLGQDIPVSDSVRGGQTLNWHGLDVHVIDTPGYTPGSVSYVIDLPGQRVACTGDLICGDGKLLDLYSLQDAIPEANVGPYHGYAARLADVITSLQQIADRQPTVLIPCRGPVIRQPQEAIAALVSRARELYANYLSIDAFRYYSQDEPFGIKARRVLGPDAQVQHMATAETVQPLPSWIVPIDNARLIVAADKTGLLIDCGSQRIIDELEKRRAAGELKSIEAIFITHYHDDHTDQAANAAQRFGARVYASQTCQDILQNPAAYRLPCLTKNPVQVTDSTPSGTQWRWKEFELTLYYFPGQTLYHDALLVKKNSGEQYFFVGDSFTPTGIDDYCLLNRNLLHDQMGFFYCLNIVKQHAPDALLINQHVEPAFRFSGQQLDEMLRVLAQRRKLLQQLTPWDDGNFAVDEGWARFHPYALAAAPGQSVQLTLRLFNHSATEQTYTVSPRLPSGWKLTSSPIVTIRIPAHTEGAVEVECRAPDEARPDVQLVTADVSWGEWVLRDWTEAMVSVE